MSDSLLSIENKEVTSYDILCELIKKYSIQQIAREIYIHIGTIKRWLLNKKVPNHYFADLNRLLGNKYQIHTTFRDKDQFFTKTKIANYCYNRTIEILDKLSINADNYTFIEPSAGCGSFYEILPSQRRIGVDIEPKGRLANQLIQSNYLDYKPQKKGNYIVIGNPPFGLRGNLALRFINHSYNFANIVAFILPPLFNSTGKGVPMTRVKHYKLAHTEKLPLNSFQYPDGKEVDIATIFQIWTKINTDKIKVSKKKTCKTIAKIYSLSDGGTPSSTRNKDMLNKCHVYLPSTCFSHMKAYSSFLELPNKRGYGVVFYKNKTKLIEAFFNKINWKSVAFSSTNSAVNLRTDLIENEIIKLGFYDE